MVKLMRQSPNSLRSVTGERWVTIKGRHFMVHSKGEVSRPLINRMEDKLKKGGWRSDKTSSNVEPRVWKRRQSRIEVSPSRKSFEPYSVRVWKEG